MDKKPSLSSINSSDNLSNASQMFGILTLNIAYIQLDEIMSEDEIMSGIDETPVATGADKSMSVKIGLKQVAAKAVPADQTPTGQYDSTEILSQASWSPADASQSESQTQLTQQYPSWLGRGVFGTGGTKKRYTHKKHKNTKRNKEYSKKRTIKKKHLKHRKNSRRH